MNSARLRVSWLIHLEEHQWQLKGVRDLDCRKLDTPYWFRMSQQVHDPQELLRRYANDSML